jgi:hypothetical protein
MALLLDGQRLTPQSRTERLLQAITFDTVIKCAPVASIAGVPLAIISARDFAMGYASHLGIPQEFVKSDPADAIAPFSIIAVLLLIGLLVLHDVDHLGFAEALRSIGRAARSFVFTITMGLYTGWAWALAAQGENIGYLAGGGIMLGLLVWWVPPLTFFILRQLFRILAAVEWACQWIIWTVHKRRRDSARHGRRDPSRPPELVGKLILITVVISGVLFLPRIFGTLTAMIDSDFTMVDRGKDHTEAILGVYGDKAFLGWIEDDVVVEVQMVAVADLEGKRIWTEEIGPLSYDPEYLAE